MATMKDLAALLGVEIGEEFDISGFVHPHRFTETTFEYLTCYGWGVSHLPNLIPDLFSGKRRIIKKPWKPKIDDTYFVVISKVYPCIWHSDIYDLAQYAVGNCFRTQEEAEKHREEVLAKLNEIYETGKPLLEW